VNVNYVVEGDIQAVGSFGVTSRLRCYAAARSKFARRMKQLPPRSKRGIRAERGRNREDA